MSSVKKHLAAKEHSVIAELLAQEMIRRGLDPNIAMQKLSLRNHDLVSSLVDTLIEREHLIGATLELVGETALPSFQEHSLREFFSYFKECFNFIDPHLWDYLPRTLSATTGGTAERYRIAQTLKSDEIFSSLEVEKWGTEAFLVSPQEITYLVSEQRSGNMDALTQDSINVFPVATQFEDAPFFFVETRMDEKGLASIPLAYMPKDFDRQQNCEYQLIVKQPLRF